MSASCEHPIHLITEHHTVYCAVCKEYLGTTAEMRQRWEDHCDDEDEKCHYEHGGHAWEVTGVERLCVPPHIELQCTRCGVRRWHRRVQ